MPPRIAKEAEVRRIFDRALAYARKRVEYADLLLERQTRIEIQQLSGNLIAKPFNAKSRVQLRLLAKGRKAEVKVGTLDLLSIKRAVDDGLKLLRASPKPERPVRLVPIPNPRKVRYGSTTPSQYPAKGVFTAIERGLNSLARKVERQAKNRYRVIPEFWFFSQREEKAIADTDGVFKTQVLPRTFLQVVSKARAEDGRTTQTRSRRGSVGSYEGIVRPVRGGGFRLTPATRAFFEQWFVRTVELQRAVTLSPARIKKLSHLILHYTTAGVFVHEALGHNFEADIVKAGGSGIIDKHGKPHGAVASDDVNIMDGPLSGDYSTGFGTEYIDDEGVEVRTKLLAERGRAVGMILNREMAAYFGLEPNGGAFSEMGDARIPRMSNTYILPATEDSWLPDLRALTRGVRLGVVLIGTGGGAVSKDGMSSSVQIGYLVENGRVTRPVKPSNFSAKTLHALRYVDGFAGPVEIGDVGFCGKGQTKFVGDGGPTWTRLKNNKYVGLSVQG